MEEWKPEEVRRTSTTTGRSPRARRQRRAGRVRGPRRARPRQGRDVRRRDRAGRHRRPVPGVQGVARRLPDRRRRLRGAGDRDRGEDLGGAGRRTASRSSSRSRSARSWTSAPADGGRDGRVPRDAPRVSRLSDPDRPSRTCCASWRRRSSASLARRSGDFDAAEDAVQEALIAAADHWPRDGVPARARAAGSSGPPSGG